MKTICISIVLLFGIAFGQVSNIFEGVGQQSATFLNAMLDDMGIILIDCPDGNAAFAEADVFFCGQHAGQASIPLFTQAWNLYFDIHSPEGWIPFEPWSSDAVDGQGTVSRPYFNENTEEALFVLYQTESHIVALAYVLWIRR
jgi:hypothetical protein